MASTETSILVLGAVMIFEPVNGYQLRRELLSWGSDEWGYLNPGSIYSMLAIQARHGHLVRHDVPEGRRTVAVYTSTPAGRAEFHRLCREALVTVSPMTPMAYQTALNFTALIPRSEYLHCLRLRIEELRRVGNEYDELSERLERTRDAPDQVPAILRMHRHVLSAELEAVQAYAARVEAGELDFAGEPPTWQPAPDDAGWPMQHERSRYQALLGLPDR